MKKSKNQFPKPHKTTTPKHQDDYVFVEKEGEDFTALKLISGPFASIVYHYGNVGFAPESEAINGALPMKFDYTVDKNPKNLILLDNKEFIDYIGDILLELLEEKLKDGTAIKD